MALLNDDFEQLSIFYENDSTVIYKGVRKKDKAHVILKSHKSQNEMFRIKHEYDLLWEKNIDGVTNVLDISYNDDKNYLVLEDMGAVVLDDYISNGGIDTSTFLKIAVNAATALASIHKEGIIHCDIKPSNILIHPDTLQVWYIDFGISFSKHERNSRGEGFAGTLEYMAPEQTGRLNMIVDHRSDLYSLGVTMYMVLSGHLPFTGETAVELIHAHTVLPPTPLYEYVQVDPVIAHIIMKLMEKSQQKRYQSAQSLAYDLALCLEALDEEGAVKEFTLGEKDIFASLEPGNKLYGKAGILDEMTALFHSTPADSANLVLLHGPIESGKTSLLNAFEEYVEENNGYLLKGSFDWKENQESYEGIRQAFSGFERYAYNQNLPLPEYTRKLSEALGENAQVLIDIMPSMEAILGKQPPVIKLNALESQERARQVFKKFFEIICNAPYPFVFVFENMQWADMNSIQLLLTAVEGKGVGNCMMVLSYRDDDPSFLQKLTPLVQHLDRRHVSVLDLLVPYLSKEDISAMVNEFFDQEETQSQELVDIIFNATGGVLAKVRMYLQMMYRTKQVQYDEATGTWQVFYENMDADVLLDMENKYKQAFDKFSAETQTALTRMACLGERFDIGEGAFVFDYPLDSLENTMKTMVEKNWLVRDKQDTAVFSFSHKTLFELCYHSLSKEEANRYHHQTVLKLYEKYRGEKSEILKRSTLFTRQILFSDHSLYTKEIIQAIGECKLIAAKEIMASANISQAAKVFQNGIKLLGENPFADYYRLAYELHLNFGMCCFALHDFEKASELFEIVLQYANNEADAYKAYHKIVTQYLSTAEWENARVYCKRYLGQAGLLLEPDADPVAAGDNEYEKFLKLTGDQGIYVCVSYDMTTDELVEHHGNMLAMLADTLLFSMDVKCKYYLYKTVNFAVEHKAIFPEFTRTFCVGAARYAAIGDFTKAKWLIDIGLEYAGKNNCGQAFLWCIYGNMVSHWVNPLDETVQIYKKAKYYALMEGNAFYEAFADMMLLNYHSFVGENLEEYHRETQTTLHNLIRSRLDALQANFTTFRQYARCLMGKTVAPDSFDDEHYKEASLEAIRNTWNGVFNDNFFYIYRMRALYIHGFYEKAMKYGQKYAELSQKVNLSAYITHAQFYYFYSLVLLEMCRIDPEQQEAYVQILEENQKHLALYAEVNPQNFAYKHKLVETGKKCLTMNNIELVDEFAEEHRVFMDKKFIWDAVFVERLITDFWLRRNIPQYVVIHKKNALTHYKKIGAKYLIRLLADVDEAPVGNMGTGTATHTHMSKSFFSTHHSQASRSQYSGINVALDFQALLEMLENLIKMDTLPALTKRFLELLVENGNAERAFLFLNDGSTVSLVASKYAIDAQSDFNDDELPVDIELIDDGLIPKKLVALSNTKEETLFANAARNEYRQIGDRYLNEKAPESLLCIPISAKGKHLGVVYLENGALAGAFPEGRIRFLQAVTLQASVLILNLQNVMVMEDYTKDLERRLSSYLGQQNALIAGIAHEINSPVGVCLTVATKMQEKTLDVIKMFTEKALSKSALGKYFEEAKEGLNIINNNIIRAGDLVQNFKKMSVEQSTEVFENLELAPTLKNIVEYIRPGVKKKIEKIELDIPEGLWIYSSSGVLAQIFTNLIMNSAIHGFEHMEKEQCQVKIQVSELENRDEIEICYTDNGKGMSEEEQEKIFQPFYTTKRNRGGSGLGGHIILTHVTRTLHGAIRCNSIEDEGTTFVIRLPKHKIEEVKEVPENA